MNKRDLVVIGGGTGGLIVTSVAAQLGLKVTMIERRDKLGGDCLHTGCVPSKTLIHTAKVASLMRRGNEFGLNAVLPEVDLGRVSDHVHSVIDQIQPHDDPERFRDYGAEVIFGHATFTGPHTVEVNGQTIQGRRFVIASGSSPSIPPIPGLDEVPYLTNENIFSLRQLPARLIVIGGGAIGVEMAQAYARLGSQVTIIERMPHLLPREDPEIGDILAESLKNEGIDILTITSVEHVSKTADVYRMQCSRESESDIELECDALLVAVGRNPNVEGMGLDAAGVVYDNRGIKVDRRMRSTSKHIFACGDVAGSYPFTHMAEYQAGIVISNAIFRFPKKTCYRVVPRVTYSDPELARVGITEQRAKEQGIKVDVLRFPFSEIDRALAEVETAGEMKLISRKGKILGATILGPHAGELIHEIVLAMQAGLKIGDISATIHAYPTLAQICRRTVNTYYGKKLFSDRTRKVVGWINKLLP
ncbi:MAG: FAD-dependent oxidoreductase [Gammaproteobacteria bacterium]|nr:MAG: FAD-dependent oxidoreductase [Gammaproteobacteria bacterium]